MCDWKRWIWPGLVTTVFLTVLATWFPARSGGGGIVFLITTWWLYLLVALAAGIIVGWMTCRHPQH